MMDKTSKTKSSGGFTMSKVEKIKQFKETKKSGAKKEVKKGNVQKKVDVKPEAKVEVQKKVEKVETVTKKKGYWKPFIKETLEAKGSLGWDEFLKIALVDDRFTANPVKRESTLGWYLNQVMINKEIKKEADKYSLIK